MRERCPQKCELNHCSDRTEASLFDGSTRLEKTTTKNNNIQTSWLKRYKHLFLTSQQALIFCGIEQVERERRGKGKDARASEVE